MAGNNTKGVMYPLRAQLSLNDWQRVSTDKALVEFSGIARYTTIKFALKSASSLSSVKNINSKLKKI